MNWLALIPIPMVLWLTLIAYGYYRMFNGSGARATHSERLSQRRHDRRTHN